MKVRTQQRRNEKNGITASTKIQHRDGQKVNFGITPFLFEKFRFMLRLGDVSQLLTDDETNSNLRAADYSRPRREDFSPQERACFVALTHLAETYVCAATIDVDMKGMPINGPTAKSNEP